MRLETAGVIADRVIYLIEDLCVKVQVAGSIRRQRPKVNDVDIVLIPKPFMWSVITTTLKNHMHAKVTAAGNELVRMQIPYSVISDPFQLDLYRASEKTWGVLLLIRTGSVQHNIMLCSKAQRIGLMLSAKDGVIKEGKVIASETEEDIFKALVLEFVPPEQREV